jgi:pimeloyl-ACP methyl ester carboxylesterase
MDIKQFKVKNKTVRVVTWGAINKPMIVCLHGLGGSAKSFIEIANELKFEYFIVSIDLPGHCGSQDLDTDFDPQYIIPWVEEAINKLSDESYYLLGHSFGATVAAHLCTSSSRKVKKMILLDGAYHDSKFAYEYNTKLYELGKLSYKPFSCLEDEVNYYIDDFDNYIFDEYEQAVQTELNNHSRNNEFIREAIEELIVESREGYRWHASGKTAKKALKFQYNSQKTIEFEKINVPVLLIYSKQPFELVECRELQINEFKSKFDLVVKAYENAGHMIHYDEPKLLAKDIRSFFSDDFESNSKIE